MSFYWDFRAAFQEYSDGKGAIDLIERLSLFTTIPQESIERLTDVRSHLI